MKILFKIKLFIILVLPLFIYGFFGITKVQASWELANRQFEKDGVPTFLWGITNITHHIPSSHFQLMKDIGFNSILTYDPLADGTADADMFAAASTTSDIGLIVSLSDFSKGYESNLLPAWFSGAALEEAQQVLVANGGWATKKFTLCLHGYSWRGTSIHLQNLTFEQKMQLVEEYYAKNEANWTSIINSSLATGNLIGFYLIDEPKTLIAQRLGELMSGLVHSLAPNASIFTIYTPGDLNDFDPPYILEPEWIAWGDVIGADAYVNPAESNVPVRTSVDFVTNNVGWQERRLKTTDKVNWVVLATDANTTEMRAMNTAYTKELQFAQTYLAIMQGAKAVVYYEYPFFNVTETTPWFEDLSVQIGKLGPIAMQPAIEQNITYDQPFELGRRYTSGEFPDVLVKLMRNPEGQYVLLAANAEDHAVSIQISTDLFENGSTVGRLFASKLYTVTGNNLTDTIEKHGVRAYTFTSSVPINDAVSIDIRAQAGT